MPLGADRKNWKVHLLKRRRVASKNIMEAAQVLVPALVVSMLVFAFFQIRRSLRPKPTPGRSVRSGRRASPAKQRSKERRERRPERSDVVEKPRWASVGLAAPTRDASVWNVAERGFLPARSPRTVPSTPALRALRDASERIPAACVDGTMRDLVLAESGVLERAADAIAGVTDEDELEVAHALYAYLVCAWARCPRVATNGAPEASAESEVGLVVPRALARGFCLAARKLGRRPMLDYCGCVLYNWTLEDPEGPVTPENAVMLRRFTGLVAEEWFFKTHLVIEAAAAPAGSAVAAGAPIAARAAAPATVRALGECLGAIEACFGRVVRDCLPLMFERSGSHGALCDYHFFFHRLRPFISGFDKAVFEGEFEGAPQTLPGPSGAMSALLPALDAFLGISNSNATLEALLADFSRSMPPAHRAFLGAVAAGRTCRAFVKEARLGGAEALGLVAAYNRCVDLVLDFRWRHLQMVKKYVLEPADLVKR